MSEKNQNPNQSQGQAQGQQTQAVARRAPAPIAMRNGVLMPSNLSEAIEFAKYIANSSMVPKQFQGQPGDVLIAIQMGAELGLSPMSALQNIAVINGRPSLWGDAVLALVLAHPECEDVIEEFDEETMTATCTVKRKGRAPVVRRFSMEDAKQAGLWGKPGPWQQYPKRLIPMRARGFALRDSFADVLRGISIYEEARDIVQTPQWVDPPESSGEPVEGVHTFGRRKALEAPKAEPAHDELTGEVQEPEPKPVEKPKPEPKAAAPKGEAKPQRDLGW